jgi:hypothetical protein
MFYNYHTLVQLGSERDSERKHEAQRSRKLSLLRKANRKTSGR